MDTARIRDVVLRSRLRRRVRRNRWRMLLDAFPALEEMRVVDLGGDVEPWLESPRRPAELTLVNLHDFHDPRLLRGHPWIETVSGDACDRLLLAGESFDLVYSNSVIEHVGGHARRIDFADVVERLGARHWVQTPNRWFPIEPHYWAPALHYLPIEARAQLARRWPLGTMTNVHPPPFWPRTAAGLRIHPMPERNARVTSIDHHHALAGTLSIEMLSASQLQFYFPASRIIRERVAGAPKSLVAVSGADD
jgi:hypothetical protein